MIPTDKKEILENFVGIIVVLVIIFVSFRFFDMSEVQAKIASAGIWAPLLFILAKASTIVFAPLSGSPLYPLAGALFGLGYGFIYIIIGDAIGGVISFYISRLLGRKFVEKFARGNIKTIDKILSFMENTKGFLVTRICFVALPEVVSYAAGLTRIKFLKFFIIQNLVGVIPSIVLVWSGVILATLTLNPTIVFVLVIGGFIVTGGGAWILIKFANKKATETENNLSQ